MKSQGLRFFIFSGTLFVVYMTRNLNYIRMKTKELPVLLLTGYLGSGKTTFLNVLSNFIPKDERIVTIEDSAELQLKNVENIVRLEARNANVEGKNAITIRDLIKASLRLRPDRIIVYTFSYA